MFRARAAFRLATIVLALLACLPLHGLSRALGRRSAWPSRLLRVAAHLMGIRSTVKGWPLASHVLLVANHRSWLDILLLGGIAGTTFVSKAEVASWPIVGRLARLNRTLFVARSRRGETRGQADALAEALAAGQPVALFAEGTTHAGPGLLPFRPALFAAVAPAPPAVRVQPVLIDYGPATSAVAWGDEPIGRNALRLLGRPGTLPVRLHFLEPLPPGRDRKAIATAAKTAIEAAMRA